MLTDNSSSETGVGPQDPLEKGWFHSCDIGYDNLQISECVYAHTQLTRSVLGMCGSRRYPRYGIPYIKCCNICVSKLSSDVLEGSLITYDIEYYVKTM